MRSALINLTASPALEPLGNIFPLLPIGGKPLWEYIAITAQKLGCTQIFLYGLTKKEIIPSQLVEKYHISFIDDLNTIVQHSPSDYLLLDGRIVLTNDAISYISTKLLESKTNISMWKFIPNNENYYYNPIYIHHEETNLSTNLERISNIELVSKDIFSGIIYIKKDINDKLFHHLLHYYYSLDHNPNPTFHIPEKITVYPLKSNTIELMTLPWQILNANELVMAEIGTDIQGSIEEHVTIHGNVVIEAGAELLNGTYIKGPVYIAKKANIGPNCFIRAGTYIGKGVHVGNAVEIKNSIIMDNTAIGHLSYFGDSVIGMDNNFGAGSKTANLAFHNQAIKMNVLNQKITTNRRKLGVFTGEKVKTGINASLMPGVKLYSKSIVGAHVLVQYDILEHMMLIYDKENRLVEKKHTFY